MGKFEDEYEFKKIEFNTWSPEKIGDNIVGVLLGKEIDVGVNKSSIYSLQTEDGEIVSVWGSSVIDPRLKNAEVGTVVKITFLGEQLSEKSGRTYKDYDVEKGTKKVVVAVASDVKEEKVE